MLKQTEIILLVTLTWLALAATGSLLILFIYGVWRMILG